MRSVLGRLAGSFRKSPADTELDEELRAHLEALTEENIRRGMEPEEAGYAARREFGGVEQAKELYREQRGLPFLETLLQDARFGARLLAKNPGFTDRKSTRLNSSHMSISYAVFCLKKKKKKKKKKIK